MASRPLILMTNDDGIDSPGLHAAAAALSDLGDLLIVAPSSQQTGAGRSYPATADSTIYPATIPLSGDNIAAYKVNASPAQAVSLAVNVVAQRPIDLCVSGINYGENLGSGVTISGTVGAAIDAACFNIPALAVSLETPKEYHLTYSKAINFEVAAHFTRLFAQQTLANGLPAKVDLLKIDVPATATPETPWRAASISRQRYYDLVYKGQVGLDGAQALDYTVNLLREKVEPNSDVYVCAVEKLVAVVPMTVDLTAPVGLAEVADFFQALSRQ